MHVYSVSPRRDIPPHPPPRAVTPLRGTSRFRLVLLLLVVVVVVVAVWLLLLVYICVHLPSVGERGSLPFELFVRPIPLVHTTFLSFRKITFAHFCASALPDARRGVGTLRCCFILSEISACRVPICAVAAWWFDSLHQNVAPGSRIPRSSSHLSHTTFRQRGVQRKQGVGNYMMSYTSLLYNATPIHCTPLPLHPPVMNAHTRLTAPPT